MPTLPPLPLVDGCLFIDNSMVELLTTCPRAMEYNRLSRRIAAVNKPSLAFGSAVHLALEHRYKTYANRPPDDALHGEISVILTKFFEEHPTPADDYRTLNWALEIVKKYNARYEIEPFQLLADAAGQPMVELSFALPLFTYRPSGYLSDLADVPVIYTGRIDLPVVWDGQLFIMDHKTTSMVGPSFFDKMRMSAQQKGYCWAFEQLTGIPVAGYAVNVIRVKEPPLYLSKDQPNPTRKTQSPAQWWTESFQRERFYLREGEVLEWKLNLISLIEEFFWHYSRGVMPMKTAWCSQYGRCQYFDVCSLPASDRGLMLSSGMYTENNWSPLKEPTQARQ